MKIYTKTGDKGKTSLLGGIRVEKNDKIIEVIGNVDEISASIGILKVLLFKKKSNFSIKELILKLERIQRELINLNAYFAGLNSLDSKRIYGVKDGWIVRLESEIDLWEKGLRPLSEFILPGENEVEASAHFVRVIVRRTERRIVELNKIIDLDKNVLKYINRLSDWFFVLARVLSE